MTDDREFQCADVRERNRRLAQWAGRHMWWEYPANGDRVFKLFLPRGGRRFLSRRAYRLCFASQCMSTLDSAHPAKDKIERRL